MVTRVIVIHGDKAMNRFLRACDVFESFKAYGAVTTMDVSHEKLLAIPGVISLVKAELEESNQKVIAAFVPGESDGAWRDPDIRVVSDGRNWCVLDDVLEGLGYRT